MKYTSLIYAIISLCITSQVYAAQEVYGQYTCNIEAVYGIDPWGLAMKHGKLLYDADAGTLYGRFDPDAELSKKGIELPFSLLFSNLKIVTLPSNVDNLTATQYDPVAWIMIETMDDPINPKFQFFSQGSRVISTGKCNKG